MRGLLGATGGLLALGVGLGITSSLLGSQRKPRYIIVSKKAKNTKRKIRVVRYYQPIKEIRGFM